MVEAIETNFASLVSSLKDLDAVRKRVNSSPDGPDRLLAACDQFCTSSKRVLRATIQSVDRMVEEHSSSRYRKQSSGDIPQLVDRSTPLGIPPQDYSRVLEKSKELVLSQKVIDYWKMYCFGQKVKRGVDKRQDEMLSHLQSAQKLAEGAKAEVSQVEQKEANLKGELQRSRMECQALMKQIHDLNHTIYNLEMENVNSQTDSRTSSFKPDEKLVQAHTDLRSLKDQLKQSDDAAKDLSLELNNLKSEQASERLALESRVSSLQSEKQSMETKISLLETKVSSLLSENQSLQSQLSSRSESLNDRDRRIAQLEDDKMRLTDAKSEIHALSKQVSAMSDMLTTADTDIKSLATQLKKSDESRKQIESDNHQLRQRLSTLEKEGVQLVNKLRDMEQLERDLANSNDRVSSLTNQLEDLSSQKLNLENLGESAGVQTAAALAPIQASVQTQFPTTNTGSSTDVAKSKLGEAQTADSDYQRMGEIIEQLAERDDALIEANKRVVALSSDITGLQSVIGEKDMALNRAKQEAMDLRNRTDLNDEVVFGLKQTIVDLGTQVKELSSRLSASSADKVSLQRMIDDLSGQLSPKQAANVALDRQVDELKLQLSSKTSECVRLQCRINELVEELDARVVEVDKVSESMLKWKTQAEQQAMTVDQRDVMIDDIKQRNEQAVMALQERLNFVVDQINEKDKYICQLQFNLCLSPTRGGESSSDDPVRQQLVESQRNVSELRLANAGLLQKVTNEQGGGSGDVEKSILDQLRRDLAHSEKLLVSKDTEISKLVASHRLGSQTISDLEGMLKSRDIELVGLRDETKQVLHEAKRMQDRYEERLRDLSVQLRDREASINETHEIEGNMHSRIHVLEERLKEKGVNETQLSARINLLDQDLNDAENEIEELTSKLGLAQKDLEAKTKAEQELRSRIEEVETAYESIVKSLKGRTSVEAVVAMGHELTELRAELAESAKAIQGLANELTESDEAALVMKNLLSAAENDLGRLVAELGDSQEHNRELQATLINAQRGENTVAVTNERLRQTERERDELVVRLRRVEEGLDLAKRDFADSLARNRELQEALANVQAGQSASVDVFMRNAERDREAILERLRDREERLETGTRRITELTNMLESMRKEMSEKENDLVVLKLDRDRLAEVLAKQKDLEIELTKSKGHLTEAELVKSSLEREIHQIEDRLASETQRFSSRIESLIRENESLKLKEGDMTPQLSQREEECESLRLQVQSIQQKADEWRTKLSAADTELEEIRQRRSRRMVANQVGRVEVFALSTKGEEQLVSVLQASLKQAENRYNELMEERVKLEAQIAQLKAADGTAKGNEELLTTIHKLVDEKSELVTRLGRLEHLLESRQTATPRTSRPPSMTFHPLSDLVRVDDSGATAIKYVGANKDADMCGCAISTAPIPLFEEGLYFEVQVIATQQSNPDGLTLGVTTTPPWTGEPVPNTLDDIPHSWAVGYNGQSWNSSKGEWKQISWCGKDLTVGQRVGVFIAPPPVSQMFVFLDDVMVCRGPTKMPSCIDYPFYALVDLLGNCDAVALIDGSRPPPIAADLVAINVRPLSLPRRSRNPVYPFSEESSIVDEGTSPIMKVAVPRLPLKRTVEPVGPARPPSDSDAETFRSRH